jgi:hypothetical protein
MFLVAVAGNGGDDEKKIPVLILIIHRGVPLKPHVS